MSVGAVRHGAFEEARPWEKLVSFGVDKADQHYYSAGDRTLLDMLSGKSKSGVGRLLATDGAFVILANFADERRSVPMHLNCADCLPVEAAMLHDRLRFEFLDRRLDLVAEQCGGEFTWSEDRPFAAHSPAVAPRLPRWVVRLVDLSIAAMLALIGWGLYKFVLR